MKARLHEMVGLPGPVRPPLVISSVNVHELLVCGAAVIAGAINSVAGGGTLVSFPTLIWLGVPSITANATNTVAIWPGSVGSAWGYRRELRGADPRVWSRFNGGSICLPRTPRGRGASWSSSDSSWRCRLC